MGKYFSSINRNSKRKDIFQVQILGIIHKMISKKSGIRWIVLQDILYTCQKYKWFSYVLCPDKEAQSLVSHDAAMPNSIAKIQYYT